MNLLERVLTLLRANLETVVEKSDDPEKVLRQLQLDMRNQLVQVKTQVATAIAESHKLQKRVKEKEAEAEAWMKKAEQAIQQGSDDTARAALVRHNELLKQGQKYLQQQQEQEQFVTTMRGALRKLDAKIAEVDTTIELLVTRKRNALLQQRVYEALNTTVTPKDKLRTEKAREAVLEAEARAQALAHLHKHDLDSQLAQLSEDQRIEQQLRDLKHRASASSEPPSLSGMQNVEALLTQRPSLKTPLKKVPQKRAKSEMEGDEQLRRLIETDAEGE